MNFNYIIHLQLKNVPIIQNVKSENIDVTDCILKAILDIEMVDIIIIIIRYHIENII